jgi:hypothetical protein
MKVFGVLSAIKDLSASEEGDRLLGQILRSLGERNEQEVEVCDNRHPLDSHRPLHTIKRVPLAWVTLAMNNRRKFRLHSSQRRRSHRDLRDIEDILPWTLLHSILSLNHPG